MAISAEHRTLRGGGYQAIHKWLRKHYGKADRCENPNCLGVSISYQWAKLADKEYEHKRENFIKLCAQCHRLYDQKPDWTRRMAVSKTKHTNMEMCRNGHIRTEANTYIQQRKFTKSLYCRTCRNESQRRYICKQQV